MIFKMLKNSFKRYFRSTCMKNGTNNNHANFQSNQAAKKERKKEKRKLEFAQTRVGKLFLQSIKTTLVKKHLLKRCHSNYLNPSIFLVPYPPIFILTVWNKEARHPLFVIISSLSQHFDDVTWSPQIILDELTAVVLSGRPTSSVSSCDTLM